MKNKKLSMPWGILSGISLMVCSLLTIAVIVVKVVSALMIQHADGDDGLGQSWWIPLLIVLAVLTLVAFIAFLVLYILRERKDKQKYLKGENLSYSPFKRSAFVLVTTYVFSWFIISLVGGKVLNNFDQNINTALNLTGTRIEVLEDTEDIDSEYFKSSFVKKDGNGMPNIVTDEDGYTHQEYDGKALRAATTALAEEVQREGSTFLWNNDSTGLPLSVGNKVSVFSHSSVDWLESGGGSGISQVNSSSTIYNELTNVGLEVNKPLWDFYAACGDEYVRDGNLNMNEVPWDELTDTSKKGVDNFSDYGDAAIIVFSRLTREASNGGNGGDATKSLADTETGDYYDFSPEEDELLDEVIALKKAGTFGKVIVLLNTPTALFMDSLVERQEDIDSCLWVGMTGYQGLHEVANILVGNSIPSGHLPDTFAYHTGSAPSSVNIEAKAYTNVDSMDLKSKSQQGRYLTYAEGIYVGYKYYETRYEDTVLNRFNATSTAGVKNSTGNWSYKEEVAFPFGHGDSYTEFEYSNYSVNKNSTGDYDVTLTVTNTGSKPGKDAAQIYVQKPYTQYDIDNGIEQASVNLAGYAKTEMLEAGESQTLNIIVRDDAFKTYDANNKKTYIREKTNGLDAYYIAAGQDAHDAMNNILAKKGKTPANTNNVMDAEGDASLVAKFDFNNDDFTTYSVSEKTGKPITNQFDNVDWNKYEHKDDNNVTYLSRSDWQGTYPKEIIKLEMSEGLKVDVGYTHEVVANPEDEMPLYDQPSTFMLADLIGKEYDDPIWEDLLNSLSIDEQISLLGSGYFGTIALPSIGKPADIAADGPMGLRRSFTYDSSIKTMSYPSPTVLSATFNDDIALRVGELMGEDALHSGCTGLYAPGVNMHRSIYGARNWEYHSEDSFLSGMIGKYRVIGSQSKGCYVHMKHFALNDQESYRHGVSVWANEQSIREIYLNAYEYAAVEGDVTGFMTSFTRFGPYWSGAHKGLCTEVARNEWGIKGFILSDSAWREYMGVVDGVLAGNDCILYKVSLSMYDIAKTNATVAKAVRESTHRILYTIANSNAMNGITSNVRIHVVQEWWQILTTNVQMALGVTTVALTAITTFIYVFYKPIVEENRRNREEKERGDK